MPELPEVKTVISHLNQNLISYKICDVIINKDKLIKEVNINTFQNSLMNQTILKLDNVGKFILFYLSNDLILVSHLRMEGKYRLENSLNELKTHDYLVLKLINVTNEIKYLIYNDTRQFGTFHLRRVNDYLSLNPLAKVAPEPHLINPQDFFQILKTKRSAIKTVLLDQSLIAGLGNIYVNEVLWAVKINPETKADMLSLDQVKQLLKVADQILKQATLLGGTTIKSFTSFGQTSGQYQSHLKVHNQVNKPCVRCLSLIQKKSVNQRGTYYCPTCQS